jgi:hypothetical protein
MIHDGKLRVHLGDKLYEYIPLNAHTLQVLADTTLRINPFTLTETSLSISISKDIELEATEQNRPTPLVLTGTSATSL